MITFKKVAKVLVDFFTIILLILLALVIYGKVSTMGKNAYPNYFGYTFFEVASGSMEPTLQINDVILVKITKDNLKKGDIIAFTQDDAIITHRIIYIDDKVLTVKGDNNNTIDNPIVIDNVIGKMVKVYPRLGIWKKVLVEPKVLLLVFITFLLFDFALSYDGKKSKSGVNKNLEDKAKSIEKNDAIADLDDSDDINVSKQIPISKKESESEELLSLTRKIDLDEINKLLEDSENVDTIQEVKDVKEKIIDEIKEEKKNKEKKNIDYTVRLDLNEIHKKIDERMR